jgi:hypothetical protein
MPCTEELSRIPKIRGARRIKLLRDVRGYDNCYNQPRGVDLVAGTVLEKAGDEGTSRGDIFFSVVGQPGVTVALPSAVLKPRHPYDLGAYDPEAVEPLYE